MGGLLLFRDLFPLEHLQHAIGNYEATDDVRGGADYGDETKHSAERAVLRTGGDDRTDERNP